LFSPGGTCTKKGVVLIFVLDPEGKILFNSSGGSKEKLFSKNKLPTGSPGKGVSAETLCSRRRGK